MESNRANKDSKKWLRLISIILTIFSLTSDVVWANPDAFNNVYWTNHLQPALMFSSPSVESGIELAVKSYMLGIGDLLKTEYHLYPTIRVGNKKLTAHLWFYPTDTSNFVSRAKAKVGKEDFSIQIDQKSGQISVTRKRYVTDRTEKQEQHIANVTAGEDASGDALRRENALREMKRILDAGGSILERFIKDKFGLDPKKDVETIVIIAKECAKQNGVGTARYFQHFDLNHVDHLNEIVEIAKECAKQNGWGTAENFQCFGLNAWDHLNEIAEIAKECAKQSGGGTAVNFQHFGLNAVKHLNEIVEISKECAKQNVLGTAENFQCFGLNAWDHLNEIVEIAKECAKKSGWGTATLFQNFGLNARDNLNEIVEIAKECAKQNVLGTAYNFQNFGLNARNHLNEIVEIAKECAKQNGWGTAENFQCFGLNAWDHLNEIAEIAKECAKQDGEGTAIYFQKFGLSFEDTKSFIKALNNIKTKENWVLVLEGIGEETGFVPTEDDWKSIVFAEPGDETTLASIRIKQRAYREYKMKNGIRLKEYPVEERILPDIAGYYKWSWESFRGFMDKNYDEFHKDPEKFAIGDITNIEIEGELPVADSAKPAPNMADGEEHKPAAGDDTNPLIISAIEMGLAVEIDVQENRVEVITRGRSKKLEDEFSSKGIFKKIRDAKDRALLETLIVERRDLNFRNLTGDECESLIKAAMKTSLSILLDRAEIGISPRGMHKLAHAGTGYTRRVMGLDPTIWLGEELLKKLSAEDLARVILEEAQHIIKPPEFAGKRWVNIDGTIDDAENPGEVIEHDAELVSRIERITESVKLSPAVTAAEYDGKARHGIEKRPKRDVTVEGLDAESVTALTKSLIDEGDIDAAEELVLLAGRKGVKGLTIQILGLWAGILHTVSPYASRKARNLQKERLALLLRRQEVVNQLFSNMHKRFFGICGDLNHANFGEYCLNILYDKKPGDGFSSKHIVFVRNVFKRMLGDKPVLSVEEEDLIRTLSVDITRSVMEARKSRRLKSVGKLSFREGMRFMKVFSRYYLKDMETAKSRIFEYFTITAWSVYGRFIKPEDRRSFINILLEMFNQEAYKDLFIDASISSGDEIRWREGFDIFDYGRFDASAEENKLPHERKILAVVERARASDMAALLSVPASYFPDAVVRTLKAQLDSVVFTMPMNGFTERKEFFGMSLPDGADGAVKWITGAIARVSEFAEANPDKKVYFVIENPDLASGDIRMALHQFLLESRVTLEGETDNTGAKKGEMVLPFNMQTVLTTESGSEIGDESFLDRASGCYLEDIPPEEIREYLKLITGIPDEIADYLVDEIYIPLKSNRDIKNKIHVQDMVQIGYYIAGRLRDNNIHTPLTVKEAAREETALHLAAKFSYLLEGPALEALKKVTGEVSRAKAEISNDGKSVVFNGIRVNMSPESAFGASVRNAIEKTGEVPSFGEALKTFFPKDYYLTDAEEHMFALLARVYKYAPSKVIFLEGLPGGGKTTIARVFLDVVGCRVLEYTVNKETDLSLFRGGRELDPAKKSGISIRIPEHWREIQRDRTGVIINEADTRLKLVEWLWPLINGRDSRHGWEFASTDPENPMGVIDFGKDGICILTGNARKYIPEVLANNISAKYFMERSEEDIVNISENIFLTGWKTLPDGLKKRISERDVRIKAKLLAGVYNDITKAVREGMFVSKREVTPRQIERFRDLLFIGMEKGGGFEETYNMLLYTVFVAMWDNPEDMSEARGIILTRVADLPPPENAELLDFVKDFPLSIPLMTFTNGTIDVDEIKRAVVSGMPEAEEVTVPLSLFHNKKNLIGGIAPLPGEETPSNKLGILPYLILKSHLSEKRVLAWLDGYLNLNPQVAPFLNEFFQTDRLPVEELLDDHTVEYVLEQVGENGAYARLAGDYKKVTGYSLPDKTETLSPEEKRLFARFLVGHKPKNLILRAVGTAEEEIKLHPADIDRFFTLNVSENYTEKWVKKRILAGLKDAAKCRLAVKCAEEAFKLFDEQKNEELYPHNRLGPKDINVFIEEIRKRHASGVLSENVIKLLSYQILAAALTRRPEDPEEGVIERDYRKAYLEAIGFDISRVEYNRKFIEKAGSFYFVIYARTAGETIELARSRTEYDRVEKADKFGRYLCRRKGKEEQIRLQAPLKGLLSQQASQLIFASYKMATALEGDPGGGKTSGSRDISRATGRGYHEEGMYKWITLGTVLGSLNIRGREIAINALDKDAAGRYMLPFLRMYSEGGSFVADEGMVSKGAGYLLRWMIEANRLEKIDLGTYHPGLQGIIVERNPEFMFSITQNDHFKTAGRNSLPWEIDRQCGKMRVDNILSYEDCRLLIDYYLEDAPMDEGLKGMLAKLHILMSARHPEKRMISPRDLIDTLVMTHEGKDLYESISISYLEGLNDAANRGTAEALVKDVFPDFNAPDYEDVVFYDRGHSNIDFTEIARLKKSSDLTRKARVLERMFDDGDSDRSGARLPARQILINEESGTDGVGFLKYFSYLTGRALDIVEGHPYLTAKLLLSGESFEFEPGFDRTGHRPAKDSFRQTYGAIGRHLVKEDALNAVPLEARVPRIIAVTNVDAIPKNELVKLNELIATRTCVLKDKTGRMVRYVLPPWITVVPITSDTDRLTSPFANRFRKLGLGETIDPEEIWRTLSIDFPNLRLDESAFFTDTARLASSNAGFEINYYFSMNELNELALRTQMFKQADRSRQVKHNDPLWYALKAVYYVYIRAMCPEDREIFVRKMAKNVLSKRLEGIGTGQMIAYINSVFKEVRAEDSRFFEREYEHHVDLTSAGGRVTELSNGFKVFRRADNITIITDSRPYSFSWDNPLMREGDGIKLSESIGVLREGNALVIKENLLAGFGITALSADKANLERAVPLGEMGSEEFMYPTSSLLDTVNALFQAQTPVRTASGRLIRPRVVLMGGETGSGKTTISKMLSKADGVPLIRVNPWRGMPATKLTVSLSLGEKVEMTVSDFLLAVGKINGKRVEAAYPTSNRVRILIDEANVTADAWYVLDAIARGEKKFFVETPAGDAVEVEIYPDVKITLAYNPPERYGGTGKGGNRYDFPAPLGRKAVKIYTPEPVEDYTDEEMRAIMKEVYKRGEAYFKRQEALKEIAATVVHGGTESGFFSVEDEIFEVERLDESDVKSYADLTADIAKRFPSSRKYGKQGLSDEEKEMFIRKTREKYAFNTETLELWIKKFEEIKDTIKASDKFIVFAGSVLAKAIIGIALETIDDKLSDKVISLAAGIDDDLAPVISDMREISANHKISETKVRAVMARLDRISRKHGCYLEDLNAAKGRPIITYSALPLLRTITFDETRLKEILGKDSYMLVFGDSVPDMLVVKRPPNGTLGYYDGRDLIVSHMDNEEKEYEVASHELGHYISDKVGKFISPEIGERLRKNIELYSVFFPIMLVENPKKYIREILTEKIKEREDDDDAYALAAITALNAFCVEYALPRVTKEFERKNIEAVMRKISLLDNKKIKDLAIKFWRGPEKYFPVVEAGFYYEHRINVKGEKNGQKRTFTLSKGPAFRPRMKVVSETELVMPDEEEAQKAPDDDKEFQDDYENVGEKRGIAQIKKSLPPASRVWMKRYQELFAAADDGDDFEVRYVPEGGTDVNPEAWVTRNADELLIAPKYEDEEKSLAQNVFFIIDVSGSIQGAPDVQDALETMLVNYTSFLLELSRKNPDLNVGLGAISTRLDVLFDFDEWKKAGSHASRRALIEDALSKIWTTGDGGGIDTPAILGKLSGIDFPVTRAKDVKNLVVVFTDGLETGSATGTGLKQMVTSFREDNNRRIDMAFVGVLLSDGGTALNENYPCFLNIEEESPDGYLDALFKMAYMQAKKMPLDGDLSATIRDLGNKSAEMARTMRGAEYRASRINKTAVLSINPAAVLVAAEGAFWMLSRASDLITEYAWISGAIAICAGIFAVWKVVRLSFSVVPDALHRENTLREMKRILDAGGSILERFREDKFGLDPEKDVKTIAIIAKECAKQNGWGTSLYFQNFGLNARDHLKEIVEIAKECAKKSGMGTALNFQNFGLSFEDTRSFIKALNNIKTKENWVMVLEGIDEETGFVMTEDDWKSIVFAEPGDETTLASIRIKQRAYREYKMKNGIRLKEYPVEERILPDIAGYYKWRWESFRDFMDENYDEFHENPEKFSKVDIANIEIVGELLDAGEAKPATNMAAKKSAQDTDSLRRETALREMRRIRDAGGSIFERFLKDKFGLDPEKDVETIAIIAKESAKQNGEETAIYFQHFGLNTASHLNEILEIAKECAKESGWGAAANFQNFGLNTWNHLDEIVEIAKECAKQSGLGTASHFQCFGLNAWDHLNEIVEIAKECAKQNGWGAAENFQRFGLSFNDTRSFLQAFNNIKTKENWSLILENIGEGTGFVPTDDDWKSIVFAESGDEMTLAAIRIKQRAYREYKMKNGIRLKEYPVEERILPDIAGYYKWSWESFRGFMDENYNEFHKDPEKFAIGDITNIEIEGELPVADPAKPAPDMAAKKSETDADALRRENALREMKKLLDAGGSILERFIKDKFGLDPEKDVKTIVIIAKECAKQNGWGTVEHFQNFGLNARDHLKEIVEIAKECAKQCGLGTAQNFQNFGLNARDHLKEIVGIAKECAKQSGWGTSLYFQNFGLNARDHLKEIVEIAKECAKQNGGGTAENFQNFGLSFKDTRSFIKALNNIKTKENWVLVLEGIGEETGFIMTEDDWKSIVFAEPGDETTLASIRIKQRAYREYKMKNGIRLKEYSVEERILPDIAGYYKLSWESFRGFMDENYDEFHKDPEKFAIGDITNIEIEGELPVADPAKPAPDMTAKKGAPDTDALRRETALREMNSLLDAGGSIIERFLKDKFGLDPEKDVEAIVIIAKGCAKQNGVGTARYFQHFDLNHVDHLNEIVEIAKECAKQNGWGTAENFQCFGLNAWDHLNDIAEIAKECAKQSGGGTARYFQNFGLKARNHLKEIVGIAKECAKQSAEGTAYNFQNFGLSFKDTESFIKALNNIKVKENWSLVLEGIGEETGFMPTIDDWKNLVIAESGDEMTLAAIRIKQRAYREYRMTKNGIHLKEYPGEETILPDISGYYKLDWGSFRDFMDENYDEFHENPEKFSGIDIVNILTEDELPDADPAKPAPDIRVLRDLFDSGELVKCLKEGIFSLTFDAKLVLAFDKDLAKWQDGQPLGRLIDTFERLKKDPAYKKMLKNLVIINEESEMLKQKVRVYENDSSARVFMFAATGSKEKVSDVGTFVKSVYINEEGFNNKPGAYYPLPEIVVLSISEYIDKRLKEGETLETLDINGRRMHLSEMNIEYVRTDSGILIFKLLPSAEEHDLRDLIKRYARIGPFLKSV